MSSSKKFRKRPVIIEAEQWSPDTRLPGVLLVKDSNGQVVQGLIKTLEGNMMVNPGDWVITGVKGERYPCKPDIFEATYEPVED